MKLKCTGKEREEILKTDRKKGVRFSIKTCPGALQRTECDSSLTSIMPHSFLLMSGDHELLSASKEQHFLFLLLCDVRAVALESLTDVMTQTETKMKRKRHIIIRAPKLRTFSTTF